MADYHNILVPYDYSEHSKAALAQAVDFAEKLGSRISLLHVLQMPTYSYDQIEGIPGPAPFDMTDLRDGAKQALEKVGQSTSFSGELSIHLVEGVSVSAMIKASAEKMQADLIVMGTHGRTGLAHVFVGSVAERTLRIAPCPVLTVRVD